MLSGVGGLDLAGLRLGLGGSTSDGARCKLVQGESLLIGMLLQEGQGGWFDLESQRERVSFICHFLCS